MRRILFGGLACKQPARQHVSLFPRQVQHRQHEQGIRIAEGDRHIATVHFHTRPDVRGVTVCIRRSVLRISIDWYCSVYLHAVYVGARPDHLSHRFTTHSGSANLYRRSAEAFALLTHRGIARYISEVRSIHQHPDERPDGLTEDCRLSGRYFGHTNTDTVQTRLTPGVTATNHPHR